LPFLSLFGSKEIVLNESLVAAKRSLTCERDAQLVASLPDRDLYMAFFRDPDHHLLALMSEQAKKI